MAGILEGVVELTECEFPPLGEEDGVNVLSGKDDEVAIGLSDELASLCATGPQAARRSIEERANRGKYRFLIMENQPFYFLVSVRIKRAPQARIARDQLNYIRSRLKNSKYFFALN